MKGLFNGKKQLYIHVDKTSDMIDAIEFAKKYKIEKTVLVGAEEAINVKDLLIAHNIPVILNRVHRLPISQDTPIDDPYTQPYKLQEAGVLFCLGYVGRMESMGSRNLPFTAGTSVAYGQKYEDAVMSISLSAAKILGIDNKVGSIETGKDATFFISSGDALDMLTNNIESAFIKGQDIDLNNHQDELFKKYNNR